MIKNEMKQIIIDINFIINIVQPENTMNTNFLLPHISWPGHAIECKDSFF